MQFNIDNLDLDRCPHCGRARPTLSQVQNWSRHQMHTVDDILRYQHRPAHRERPVDPDSHPYWGLYECTGCHRLVMAEFIETVITGAGDSTRSYEFVQCWPEVQQVPQEVQGRARQHLLDAIESPPGPAVVAAAAAVDAMLKQRNYTDGSVYSRIEQAAEDQLITSIMKEWAHEIRDIANAERHSDLDAGPPDEAEKRRILAFAFALAEYLFVLPARIHANRSQNPPAPSPQ